MEWIDRESHIFTQQALYLCMMCTKALEGSASKEVHHSRLKLDCCVAVYKPFIEKFFHINSVQSA